MTDKQQKVDRILAKIGASRTERELYQRGASRLSDSALDELEHDLDRAMGNAPVALRAADKLLRRRETEHTNASRHAGSGATGKRKQSLYFPESMLQEVCREASRLDRSLSWIVQRGVRVGLPDIRRLPSVNEAVGADEEGETEAGVA